MTVSGTSGVFVIHQRVSQQDIARYDGPDGSSDAVQQRRLRSWIYIYFFYKISLHFTYCCLGFQQMWRDEKEAKKERKGGENKILGSFQLGDVSEEW